MMVIWHNPFSLSALSLTPAATIDGHAEIAYHYADAVNTWREFAFYLMDQQTWHVSLSARRPQTASDAD